MRFSKGDELRLVLFLLPGFCARCLKKIRFFGHIFPVFFRCLLAISPYIRYNNNIAVKSGENSLSVEKLSMPEPQLFAERRHRI